jgi:hypothetical protein
MVRGCEVRGTSMYPVIIAYKVIPVDLYSSKATYIRETNFSL